MCSTHTTYQFTPAQREELSLAPIDLSGRRDVYRIAMQAAEAAFSRLWLTCYEGSAVRERYLAHCDYHGRWLEWLEPERHATEDV